MIEENDVHSRSRLAGYKPEILSAAIVLIVGVGALGQNLAMDLALAGVGEINIVDFDVFEPHNVTRSPLYPNKHEQEQWSLEKARVVAYKLLPMMTASSPRIHYAMKPIQALGDLPLVHSDIVFAAVDNMAARAYLAERCHTIHRPLIEGGFHAEIFNLTVFGPDADDPCYRCVFPKKVGAYSCTRYALYVEQNHVIPAIQNTAAVLAGLQAEAGIQWLHGEHSLRNQRIHGNTRTMSMNASILPASPDCPGVHEQQMYNTSIVLDVKENAPLQDLLTAIEKEVGPAVIYLPDQFIMRNFCTRCNIVVDAYVPEWHWLTNPRCISCGGPFVPNIDGHYIRDINTVHTSEHDKILDLHCATVGFTAGTMIEVWPDQPSEHFNIPNSCYLLQMNGTMGQIMTLLSKDSATT